MATGNSPNMDEAGIQTFNTSTGNLTGSTTTQYNVLIGDTNNKLTNVAPSATSGVPLISSGSSANPVFGTAVVAGGGTGNTTFTAYSVICAGTSSTGAFQNVSGVGTSGQALTSNGAAALPTWQDSGSGYNLQMQTAAASIIANTYFMANSISITGRTTSGGTMQKMFVPRSGTITACYGGFTATVIGSSENISVILRINNTTDVTVTATATVDAAIDTFSNNGLSTAVTAGDFIEIKVVMPSFSTTPTCSFNGSILIT